MVNKDLEKSRDDYLKNNTSDGILSKLDGLPPCYYDEFNNPAGFVITKDSEGIYTGKYAFDDGRDEEVIYSSSSFESVINSLTDYFYG